MTRPTARILTGSCLDLLPTLPERSVQVCMTSPPYFALRSYLPAGHPDKGREIGSEPTPDAFIATMVEVFRRVRRVLRDDGMLWINLGDGYGANQARSGIAIDSYRGSDTPTLNKQHQNRVTADGFTGQLLNLPHRVAEALRADGWIWRQTIVWAKRSPMPESVGGVRWERCRVKVAPRPRGIEAWAVETGQKDNGPAGGVASAPNATWSPCPGCPKCRDNGGYVLRRGRWRCTGAHEYVFLFSKSERYFADAEAAKEPQSEGTHARFKAGGRISARKKCGDAGETKSNDSYARGTANAIIGGRNPRSVWTLSSEPTRLRHFATFPSELVRRCLVPALGCARCCPECGEVWAPVVEVDTIIGAMRDNAVGKGLNELDNRAGYPRGVNANRVLSHRPTCTCGRTDYARPLVLDPFSGIATTGQTAIALGADYIGLELNPEYAEIGRTRVYETPRWKLRQSKPKAKRIKLPATEPDLFGARATA